MGVKHHFQQYFSLIYLGSQFHWRRKSEWRLKINDLSLITIKNIKLYQVHLTMSGNLTHNLKGRSCQFNYHIIKANCQIFQFLFVITID